MIFHRLLSMFHVRPFIFSRFPPQGTAAVVRAQYGPFLEIYFRFVFLIILISETLNIYSYVEFMRNIN